MYQSIEIIYRKKENPTLLVNQPYLETFDKV